MKSVVSFGIIVCLLGSVAGTERLPARAARARLLAHRAGNLEAKQIRDEDITQIRDEDITARIEYNPDTTLAEPWLLLRTEWKKNCQALVTNSWDKSTLSRDRLKQNVGSDQELQTKFGPAFNERIADVLYGLYYTN